MLFPMVYHEKDQIFHQQIPVGGLEHFFPIILGIMILTDELIFFRGVGIPPTRYFKQGSPVLFPMAFPTFSLPGLGSLHRRPEPCGAGGSVAAFGLCLGERRQGPWGVGRKLTIGKPWETINNHGFIARTPFHVPWARPQSSAAEDNHLV